MQLNRNKMPCIALFGARFFLCHPPEKSLVLSGVAYLKLHLFAVGAGVVAHV